MPNFDHDLIVSVTGGLIRGTYSEDRQIAIFKGIPFAASTAGENRFRPPQPVEPWDGVRDCDRLAPSTVQNPQAPFLCWSKEFIVDPDLGYSEDCLYLNVWTEAVAATDKRPVFVYIYGGGNTSGGTSCDIYDGEGVARKGAVYVSITYRVGIFGFLAHPGLTAEQGVSGNYAIKDLISALQWVRDNIASFGGDPDNVTIAGQSAGSMNTWSLISSPAAKGLFHKAFCMSFNAVNFPCRTLADAEASGYKAVGGRSVEELRAMTTDELLDLQNAAGGMGEWSTCIDGQTIVASVRDSFLQGTANDVPTISGMVTGDTDLFGAWRARRTSVSQEEFTTAARSLFGDLADDFLAVYPFQATPFAPYADKIIAQVSEDEAMALQFLMGQTRATKGNTPFYLYLFTHPMPGPEILVHGCFHTADVPYWFNHFSAAREEYWAPVDYRIGDEMSDYLVNFISTGDPNGDGLPAFATWTPEGLKYTRIGAASTICEMPPERLEFWKKYLKL